MVDQIIQDNYYYVHKPHAIVMIMQQHITFQAIFSLATLKHVIQNLS